MSKANIYEFELNFSNICQAECIICSRPHGRGNKAFMDWDVFNTLVEQMKDIEFEQIQTSGNGEAFLNPNYLDYIRILRKEFPNVPLWTYNNFSHWTPERSDQIIKEKLFDRIHVRIDSLEKWVFERNSNLNQETVFNNLIYFLEYNKDIPVVILYNNINDYYKRCKDVLGIRPTRDFFTDDELAKVKDEEQDILEFFQKHSKNVTLDMCRIGHSLWGERTKCEKDETYPCPKLDIIKNITWICPDGSVETCCYSDCQSHFVCGNIMEEHIGDIFNGEKRAEILDNIEKRVYKDYPCTNPRCCEFPVERKI